MVVVVYTADMRSVSIQYVPAYVEVILAFNPTESHFGDAIFQLAQFLVVKLVAEIIPLAERLTVVWRIQLVGFSCLFRLAVRYKRNLPGVRALMCRLIQ